MIADLLVLALLACPSLPRRLASGVVMLWVLALHVLPPHFKMPYFLRNAPPESLIGQALPLLVNSLPGFKATLEAVNEDTRELLKHFVATPQENHKAFRDKRLHAFQGFRDVALPPDAVTRAMAIGVVGYYVRVPLIDDYGLTDRFVATQVKTTNNEEKRHSHNRQAPEGYFAERGVNFIPVCVLPPELSQGVIAPQQIAQCNPFYKDYSGMPLYTGVYNGVRMAFRSPNADWVAANFSEGRMILER